MNTDVVIGLEIHVTLKTASKLFCGCRTAAEPGEEDLPNARTCEVCLGHPGSKPVLNRKALEYGIKLGLALGCKISSSINFSRKTYFYPDMSKNYQITQFEIPLGTGGEVVLDSGKKVRLKRIHLEEDPASLVHVGKITTSPYVLVDYNRSGVPLCEIVTEPDMSSAEEAREFMKKLISVLSYIGVFDLEKGIIKADANVSIKEKNYRRVEVKNITGFKEIERALNYEIKRQKQEKVVQETRAWDSDEGVTRTLRGKETEEDYGFIIDPDLVETEIDNNYVSKIKATIPELAAQKIERFAKQYKVKKEDAQVLASDFLLADLFERAAKKVRPETAVEWIRKELLGILNYNSKEFSEVKLDEKEFFDLMEMVEKNQITKEIARNILRKLPFQQMNVKEFVKKEGLTAISGESELRKLCELALIANPKPVEDYRKGGAKALDFIVGQVMRQTKGTAKPDAVKKILMELIK